MIRLHVEPIVSLDDVRPEQKVGVAATVRRLCCRIASAGGSRRHRAGAPAPRFFQVLFDSLRTTRRNNSIYKTNSRCLPGSGKRMRDFAFLRLLKLPICLQQTARVSSNSTSNGYAHDQMITSSVVTCLSSLQSASSLHIHNVCEPQRFCTRESIKGKVGWYLSYCGMLFGPACSNLPHMPMALRLPSYRRV